MRPVLICWKSFLSGSALPSDTCLEQSFPGREVRAGLERLYKKVEKHLSEEENLLQVVWHHMQVQSIVMQLYNSLPEDHMMQTAAAVQCNYIV